MSNRRMLDMCWLSLLIGVCLAVAPRAAAAQELTSAVSGMTGLGQHLDTLTANAAHAATLADDGAMGSLADVNALQMRQLQASTTPSLTQASQVGEALTARLQQATDSLTALIPSWRSMTASTDPTIANSMAVMSDSTQKLVQGVKAGIDAATKLVSASVRSSGEQAQPILSSLNVVLPKLSSQLSSLSGVLGSAATSPTATQLRASASSSAQGLGSSILSALQTLQKTLSSPQQSLTNPQPLFQPGDIMRIASQVVNAGTSLGSAASTSANKASLLNQGVSGLSQLLKTYLQPTTSTVTTTPTLFGSQLQSLSSLVTANPSLLTQFSSLFQNWALPSAGRRLLQDGAAMPVFTMYSPSGSNLGKPIDGGDLGSALIAAVLAASKDPEAQAGLQAANTVTTNTQSLFGTLSDVAGRLLPSALVLPQIVTGLANTTTSTSTPAATPTTASTPAAATTTSRNTLDMMSLLLGPVNDTDTASNTSSWLSLWPTLEYDGDYDATALPASNNTASEPSSAASPAALMAQSAGSLASNTTRSASSDSSSNSSFPLLESLVRMLGDSQNSTRVNTSALFRSSSSSMPLIDSLTKLLAGNSSATTLRPASPPPRNVTTLLSELRSGSLLGGGVAAVSSPAAKPVLSANDIGTGKNVQVLASQMQQAVGEALTGLGSLSSSAPSTKAATPSSAPALGLLGELGSGKNAAAFANLVAANMVTPGASATAPATRAAVTPSPSLAAVAANLGSGKNVQALATQMGQAAVTQLVSNIRASVNPTTTTTAAVTATPATRLASAFADLGTGKNAAAIGEALGLSTSTATGSSPWANYATWRTLSDWRAALTPAPAPSPAATSTRGRSLLEQAGSTNNSAVTLPFLTSVSSRVAQNVNATPNAVTKAINAAIDSMNNASMRIRSRVPGLLPALNSSIAARVGTRANSTTVTPVTGAKPVLNVSDIGTGKNVQALTSQMQQAASEAVSGFRQSTPVAAGPAAEAVIANLGTGKNVQALVTELQTSLGLPVASPAQPVAASWGSGQNLRTLWAQLTSMLPGSGASPSSTPVTASSGRVLLQDTVNTTFPFLAAVTEQVAQNLNTTPNVVAKAAANATAALRSAVGSLLPGLASSSNNTVAAAKSVLNVSDIGTGKNVQALTSQMQQAASEVMSGLRQSTPAATGAAAPVNWLTDATSKLWTGQNAQAALDRAGLGGLTTTSTSLSDLGTGKNVASMWQWFTSTMQPFLRRGAILGTAPAPVAAGRVLAQASEEGVGASAGPMGRRSGGQN